MLIVVAVLAGIGLLLGVGVAFAILVRKFQRERRAGQYRGAAATPNFAGEFVPDPSHPRGGTYRPPARASEGHSAGYFVGAGAGEFYFTVILHANHAHSLTRSP